MQTTLAEIAKTVGGELVGDPQTSITGVRGIRDAQPGDLTFVANSKYQSFVAQTKASAILITEDAESPTGKAYIRVPNPSLAFAKIISSFYQTDKPQITGVHPTVHMGKNVQLGKNVAIGAFCVIEDDVSIGDDSLIQQHGFIGRQTTIGREACFHPSVTVLERSVIGNRVIIHSGSVIGSDGFGFENVDGVHEKIPQIGQVVIEDDVEIGANVTIDRARFDKTVIGQGTKIDNLVQIGHNVQIGKQSIIVSQVGISGSVVIEDGVILAGQAGVAGHLRIGKKAIVAAQSGVTKDVPAETTVSGFPARDHREAKRVNAALQRLPEYVKTIQDLKARIEELERKIGDA